MAYRVLFFSDSEEFGGAEQALVNLMAGLDRQRWDTALYYHRSTGIDPLVHAARDLSVDLTAVPPMPLGLCGARKALLLAREIRIQHPALFHANLTWPLSCKYALLAAVLARVPVIIAVLHSFVDIPYTRSTRAQLKMFSRKINCYIAVSNDLKTKFGQAFDIPEEKIQVIHNGIPVDSFSKDRIPENENGKTLSPARGNPFVLTVARLVEKKGLEDLIESAALLPEVTFLVAGEGPLRRSLELQAHALGVTDRVKFIGYVDDLGSLLRGCDLFVLPSHNEGLPLSILEAMAAGKAVVATQVGGIGEAVIDGETGWVIPPAAPDQLATSIRSLLGDPQLARRFGEAGRERVLRLFTVKKMVKSYTSTYETLLRANGVLDGP